MHVPLSEGESDQITHALNIVIVRLFNVILFETEMETSPVLWVGFVHTRNYDYTSVRLYRIGPAPLSANNNNIIGTQYDNNIHQIQTSPFSFPSPGVNYLALMLHEYWV